MPVLAQAEMNVVVAPDATLIVPLLVMPPMPSKLSVPALTFSVPLLMSVMAWVSRVVPALLLVMVAPT